MRKHLTFTKFRNSEKIKRRRSLSSPTLIAQRRIRNMCISKFSNIPKISKYYFNGKQFSVSFSVLFSSVVFRLVQGVEVQKTMGQVCSPKAYT